MKGERISLSNVLELFKDETKIEEMKTVYPKEIEDVLERMIIVLHRQDKRIERIEKVTRLIAKEIENMKETAELIEKNANENDYKLLVSNNR